MTDNATEILNALELFKRLDDHEGEVNCRNLCIATTDGREMWAVYDTALPKEQVWEKPLGRDKCLAKAIHYAAVTCGYYETTTSENANQVAIQLLERQGYTVNPPDNGDNE